MGKTTRMKMTGIVCGLVGMLCLPVSALAELLSRIEVQRNDGVGVIHIILTRPVVLTSFFPEKQSYLLHIYFNDVAAAAGAQTYAPHGSGRSSASTQLVDEYMHPSPTGVVPDFWVTFQAHGVNDSALEPSHLMVQFKHEVKYKVQQDRDNRGFYIFVLDESQPGSDETVPAKKPPVPETKPSDEVPTTSEPN
jgi:hypothetical protein